MNLYKSGAELKDLAKCKLERNYGVSILAILTVGILKYSANMFLPELIPVNTFGQFLFYCFIGFLLSAFLGVFEVGTCLFFLNMACGYPYKLEQLFHGFQNNAKGAFSVSLITGMVSLLYSLPSRILLRMYLDTKESYYISWALLAFLVGFILYIPLSLLFSQSFYLLFDFPDCSGKQALFTSCRLMKKHIGKLLWIKLSFLPLTVLCIFTFFIGFLWLIPYMKMTYTLFFLDIMNGTTSK